MERTEWERQRQTEIKCETERVVEWKIERGRGERGGVEQRQG